MLVIAVAEQKKLSGWVKPIGHAFSCQLTRDISLDFNEPHTMAIVSDKVNLDFTRSKWDSYVPRHSSSYNPGHVGGGTPCDECR